MLEPALDATPSFFTLTSLVSLLAVLGLLLVALLTARALLPARTSRKDTSIFVWLVFDALTHFILEGSFIFHSFPVSRTVNTGTGPFAALWREYARADARWGNSDPVIVALELLTVFGDGALCVYIAYLMTKGDRAREYWMVILCVAEIYGGWMTFVPDWLVGSPNLNTDNWLFCWVYLAFFNGIWVVIPLWLLYDSWKKISVALRREDKVATRKKK